MNSLLLMTMDDEILGFIASMIFCVFLWCFIMIFWTASCKIGIVKDFPRGSIFGKPLRVKPAIEPEPEPEQDPDWFGTWNDKPEFSDFDPNPESKLKPMFEPEPEPELQPQTDPKLIEEVIEGLQNMGFKKRDAKAAVLRACERGVFEDHQSLVQAALDKSNV